MSEQKLKSYEMRIVNRPWTTGYQAKNAKSAIKMFINDKRHNFKSGKYTVEVRGYKKFFSVTKILGLNHPPIVRIRMAEQKLKSYEMRIVNRPWANSYQAKNVKTAVKMFINDKIYHFKPGTYNIEVKGYKKLFTVTKVLGFNHPPIVEMVKLDNRHQCIGTYCVKKTKPLIKGTRVLRLKFRGQKQIILCEECTLNFFRKIEGIREDIVENFFRQKGNYVS